MAPIVFDFYIGLSEHFMTENQKEALYIWKVKLKVGFPLPVLECMLICSWDRCILSGSSEHARDLGLDFQCFLLKEPVLLGEQLILGLGRHTHSKILP